MLDKVDQEKILDAASAALDTALDQEGISSFPQRLFTATKRFLEDPESLVAPEWTQLLSELSTNTYS